MKIIKTKFKSLLLIKSHSYNDNRGYFKELYLKKFINKKVFQGNDFPFWCLSKSKKNVLRGLHFQKNKQQAKFVSVIKGKILDISVDLRKNSQTFGKYFSIRLSDTNSTSILIPKGFAHGFLGLEKENIIFYGMGNYRSKKDEMGILWNDKDLSISWPNKKFIISKKDKKNISFKQFKKLKRNF